MPEYTQFDLVDVLTGSAARMGWEAVAAETSATHAVLSFRNPGAIAQQLASQDPSVVGFRRERAPDEGDAGDGPGHRD
jgi:hypothetical protein